MLMEEDHNIQKLDSIQSYLSCLISNNDCLVELDNRLYKPQEFLEFLEQHDGICLDTHSFYTCCEGFMKSYHYSVKLGWAASDEAEKKFIAIIYW